MTQELSLLIVDDEKTVLDSFYILIGNKCVLYYAATLKEGYEIAKTVDVSLLFVDVNLPDGNGFDLLEWMSTRQKKAPIVIMTADPHPITREKAFRYGAFNYISKPFSIDTIYSILQKIDPLFQVFDAINPNRLEQASE